MLSTSRAIKRYATWQAKNEFGFFRFAVRNLPNKVTQRAWGLRLQNQSPCKCSKQTGNDGINVRLSLICKCVTGLHIRCALAFASSHKHSLTHTILLSQANKTKRSRCALFLAHICMRCAPFAISMFQVFRMIRWVSVAAGWTPKTHCCSSSARFWNSS